MASLAQTSRLATSSWPPARSKCRRRRHRPWAAPPASSVRDTTTVKPFPSRSLAGIELHRECLVLLVDRLARFRLADPARIDAAVAGVEEHGHVAVARGRVELDARPRLEFLGVDGPPRHDPGAPRLCAPASRRRRTTAPPPRPAAAAVVSTVARASRRHLLSGRTVGLLTFSTRPIALPPPYGARRSMWWRLGARRDAVQAAVFRRRRGPRRPRRANATARDRRWSPTTRRWRARGGA